MGIPGINNTKYKVVCPECGRTISIFDVHKKKLTCYYCKASGDNPYYAKQGEAKFIKKGAIYERR